MTTVARLLQGYDRTSAYTLVLLVVGYFTIGAIWHDYLDFSRGMDWLLFWIWAFMTALLCWGIDLKRDLVRAVVGLGGGLYIEAWGTQTDIWWYFTAERPPIWILPAWPVAAIAIDRLSRAVDLVLPEGRHDWLWWGMLPPFVVVMTIFVWPYAHLSFTQLSIVAMLAVLLWRGDVRQDVTLMLAGAGLGLFLEYWGTSRRCWNYYTGDVPPIAAVLAHGYASVAFQRIVAVGEALVARVSDPRTRRV